MWRKRTLLLLIFLVSYLHLMVNNPVREIKTIGLEPLQKIAARQIDYADHIQFIYQPELRPLTIAKEELTVKAITPGPDDNFKQIAEQLTESDGFAIVQCSAMDSWHTSETGKAYLMKMYPRGYRIVVFDGGHHLPTLGLAPDILVVPQMCGYAVHSYMQDGMQIKKLKELAADLELSCVIAVLPRWAVFKQQQALESVTKIIIEKSDYNKNPAGVLNINTEYHMSKYNHRILLYIDQNYYRHTEVLLERIKGLGTDDVDKIYLAFDYKKINRQQAKDFAAWLGKELAVAIETVNEPVYVFNAFWGDRSVLSE
ncbi:MAG TPA: hypothetical protein PKV15_00050 [Syntrophomonadaceae bacterium]|jgi:hypothetical protein|nr:hypothetical protein [Syntrophomonadaceae bacterium]HRX20078.1 hypothetical protein [Syntrophomonadaceae bacterium]